MWGSSRATALLVSFGDGRPLTMLLVANKERDRRRVLEKLHREPNYWQRSTMSSRVPPGRGARRSALWLVGGFIGLVVGVAALIGLITLIAKLVD